MKNPVLYILALVTVFSCLESQEPLVETGSLTIGFQSSDVSGGRSSALAGTSLEGASSIFITIADSKNNIIVDKEISLIKLNGEYLTEAIPLTEGSYTLTRFLVLDEKDNALYATPVQGSRDARLVEHSLPVSFVISHNKATSLPLEVISLKLRSAKDIGYVSFQIIHKCPIYATIDGRDLCFDDSRYLIAYASVPGEPSFFSLSTSYTPHGDKGRSQIIIETDEFRGPGRYTLRRFDGGSERSTYGYFFTIDVDNKQVREYNSVSGTLVVETIKPIKGTSSGLAIGTFTMTAQDDQGNTVNVNGSFNDLRGMGQW